MTKLTDTFYLLDGKLYAKGWNGVTYVYAAGAWVAVK